MYTIKLFIHMYVDLTTLLAVLLRVLLAQRSEAITSLAVSEGLNLALGWFSSRSILLNVN